MSKSEDWDRVRKGVKVACGVFKEKPEPCPKPCCVGGIKGVGGVTDLMCWTDLDKENSIKFKNHTNGPIFAKKRRIYLRES